MRNTTRPTMAVICCQKVVSTAATALAHPQQQLGHQLVEPLMTVPLRPEGVEIERLGTLENPVVE